MILGSIYVLSLPYSLWSSSWAYSPLHLGLIASLLSPSRRVASLLDRGAAYRKRKEEKAHLPLGPLFHYQEWGETILLEADFAFLENEREKIAFNIAFDLIVYGAIIFPKLRYQPREKDFCFFSKFSGSKRCACGNRNPSETIPGGAFRPGPVLQGPLLSWLWATLSFSWASTIALMRAGSLSPYTSISGSPPQSTVTSTSSRGGRSRSMSHPGKEFKLDAPEPRTILTSAKYGKPLTVRTLIPRIKIKSF